ncbi:CBS-domain-containing protein [Ramicandelaber brevisporus]|nr:CBS-domain-containing protein [Ramicandelaber brevisporus]
MSTRHLPPGNKHKQLHELCYNELDIPAGAKLALVAATTETTVRDALALLAEHSILSLPVYSGFRPGEITAIISIVDILIYLTGGDLATSADMTKFDAAVAEDRLGHTVERTLTLDSDRESYRVARYECIEPLRDAIRAMGSGGLHRVLVVDVDGRGSGKQPPVLLSQTDVVRYIELHPDCVSSLDLDSSVEDCLKQLLVTVPSDSTTALTAVRRIASDKVGAVAVIDADGRIVANFSASDCRGLVNTTLSALNMPVLEFLSRVTATQKAPVVCTPGSTLRQVIEVMHVNNIHRVWVVDDEKKPTGVITLTDVLRLVELASSH